MRWLRAWWRKRRGGRQERSAPALRAESERKLREVERMAPKVDRLAEQLNGELAVNNFAALVQKAFRERRS